MKIPTPRSFPGRRDDLKMPSCRRAPNFIGAPGMH